MAFGDDQQDQPVQVQQQPMQPPPYQPPFQQVPPQQPITVKPTWMEQYSPLVGAAVMGYLNAISAPRYMGYGNAARQGVAGALGTYGGLSEMAQQHEAMRQRRQALQGLTPEQQRMYTLGGPATIETMMKTGNVPANNAAILQSVESYLRDPTITPSQRAAATAARENILANPSAPHKFEDVARAIHMGTAPKPGEGHVVTVMENGVPTVKIMPPGTTGVVGQAVMEPKPKAAPSPEELSVTDVKTGRDAYNKAYNNYVKTHPKHFWESSDDYAAAADAAGKQAEQQALKDLSASRAGHAGGRGQRPAPEPAPSGGGGGDLTPTHRFNPATGQIEPIQ